MSALRQGAYTIRELGSSSLASGAESLARPVGKTGLRVVAATPDGIEAPLGLGAIPALVASVLLALLAIAALLVSRGKLNLRPRGRVFAAEDSEPTLGQTLQLEPLPVAGVRNTAETDATLAW